MFTFFKGILYGFISGCAEILPISFGAHKNILLKLFGMQSSVPFCDLLIHIALAAALIYSCQSSIQLLIHDHRPTRKIKGHTYKSPAKLDRQFLKSAAIPMLLGQLLCFLIGGFDGKLLYVALFLTINGGLIFLQEYIPHGNKNAGHFSTLDAILMGITTLFSVFPGISRTSLLLTYGVMRGGDRQTVVRWILLLTIPVMLLQCVFDLITIITVGFGITSFLVFLYCIVSAIFAFLGAYLAISLIRALSTRTGYSAFSYYSWGAALFCVVLFLIA